MVAFLRGDSHCGHPYAAACLVSSYPILVSIFPFAEMVRTKFMLSLICPLGIFSFDGYIYFICIQFIS